MKPLSPPRLHLFTSTPRISAALLLALTHRVAAGDILRGGSSAAAPTTPSATAALIAQQQQQARANAQDALARTTQAINAVKAMQANARAAASGSVTAPRPNPNAPGQFLPAVPNGLAAGGLKLSGSPVGALNPVQATTPAGRTNVTIKQTAQQAMLDWETFNVGRETTVKFDQSAAGSSASQWIAFNRITDPSGAPSQILGNIEAQGQVYVLNPNGILFGATSQVNLHTLTASSLPINDNLVSRGLLNNPDSQFLFSALPIPAGSKGTPAFTPAAPPSATGRFGDITVEAGAQISSPVSADGNGGRIFLVAPNVTNAGTLSTPAGQTILAAGLQTGVQAHRSDDPGLRGLDVYVGTTGTYGGQVTNTGLIEVPRGNAWLAGGSIAHSGVIDSSTSVTLNGRIELHASYDAVPNSGYDPAIATTGAPFLFKSTGHVELGTGSVLRILPETESTATVAGAKLALGSEINIEGRAVHFAPQSTLLAPGALTTIRAGRWVYDGSLTPPKSTFINDGGQVYIDSGSLLSVAGTAGAAASVQQNILTLQLRAAELAGSPLQRDGALRGATITVNAGRTGTWNGREWVGTPLADISGYMGLVQRRVGQLTAEGGMLNISAGESVVVREGSTLDVSGGFTDFQGAHVRTSQVLSGGNLLDIADATPDLVYSGLYTGNSNLTSDRWGATEQYPHAISPGGTHYEEGYTQGANAGTLSITSPSMALDGNLLGRSVAGTLQLRSGTASSALPRSGTLHLAFHGQSAAAPAYLTTYPSPPEIFFRNGAAQTTPAAFALDAAGEPLPLEASRKAVVSLSPDLAPEGGFGTLRVQNEDGAISVPEGTHLTLNPGGHLSLTASNITVSGRVTAPAGTLDFKALNVSPYDAAVLAVKVPPELPPVREGLGVFTLTPGAVTSTAGLAVNDLLNSASPAGVPAAINGGAINIAAFTANLAAGSRLDVSGGVLVDSQGRPHYGDGGSLSIKAGQDPNTGAVLGGKLNLGSSLHGYSGAVAGSLTVQSQLVQIGGSALTPDSLVLAPEFFRSGGFGTYTVTGLGEPGQSIPAVSVAPGTVVEPVTQRLQVEVPAKPGEEVKLAIIEDLPGIRTPVKLNLNAPGVEGLEGLQVRGDIVIGEGSVLRTDPLGSISLTGNTVAVLGGLFAPGGTITVNGARNSTPLRFADSTQALTTVYTGPKSVLSTAGTTILLPDAYRRRIGSVLPGGQINMSGNITAAAGAVLDVSGTSGTLDLHPSVAAPLQTYRARGSSGLSDELYAISTVPVRIDSNGGSITLSGGQMLASDATLLGGAGGALGTGGTLSISSGRFYAPGVLPPVLDTNLVVTQSGPVIQNPPAAGTGAIGQPQTDRGRFAAERFTTGGFDSLNLGGVVEFSGPVNIDARGSISAGKSGLLFANAAVQLNAPYVSLGTAFQPPVRTEDRAGQLPFLNVPPAHGSGSLTVNAGTIDTGTLALQNIGTAHLNANGGDLRGSGILTIAGDLTLRAGQIHPVTASDFTVVAYDHGGTSGSISIQSAGSRQLPLSAAGTLNVYASAIHQNGVLRAPFGTINLGWDGTGTAPRELLTGSALPFPVTSQLMLGTRSVTSVSAVDPATGKGLTLPYGISPDGTTWVDPRGVDITATGLPEKNILLSAGNIALGEGATVDLRGGGDLFAYRWVSGQGGTEDILASETRFAIVPGYQPVLAAAAPYNTSDSDTNLIAASGPGYVNNTLLAGERIYLAGNKTLPEGTYRLLPARYALLPGAVLVTPARGAPSGTNEMPGGFSIVSGYRYSALDPNRAVSTVASQFEVAPGTVVRARAQYDTFLANTFFKQASQSLNLAVPRLPADSGSLVFQAAQSMNLSGSVASGSIAAGRGASIDITSPLDILITGGTAEPVTDAITLSAAALNGFGAESLLIGGRRTRGANGSTVSVRSGNITVDNAGTPLAGPDVILASNESLVLAAGASVASAGSLPAGAEALQFTGRGTALRVSQDSASRFQRTAIASAAGPSLTIASGATLSGGAVTLDSTAVTVIDPTAILSAGAFAINSGRIGIQLADAGTLPPEAGLILGGTPLQNLQSASSLSLLSYSSLDIYGTGQVGSADLANLTLSAGAIRGFGQGEGTVVFKGQDILLQNTSGAAAPTATATATATNGGTLCFDAKVMRAGEGQLEINQFANVTMEATQRFTGEGTGGLTVQRDLDVISPLVTGSAGAVRSLTAGGELSLTSSSGTGDASGAGLGSTLNLSGASITADTRIHLPSGLLSVRATSGDLIVQGRMDVSGVHQSFYDTERYTDAGSIRLAADKGSVVLTPGAVVNVAAPAGGGNAGTLSVATPGGAFVSQGTLQAAGGLGGRNGSFELDTAALPSLAALSTTLTNAAFTNQQRIRVRGGDVLIDGAARSRDFSLSADTGSVKVTGTIDASGVTGGTIRLAAHGDLTVTGGGVLNAAGQKFSNAGKGGSIQLESGTSLNGVAGTGVLDLQTGSTIDLSVAAFVAGDAGTSGSSAYQGQFSGRLHLRAPQNAGFSDVLVNSLGSTISGASSILVEGYRVYDLTSTGGEITAAVQAAIRNDGQTLFGNAGSASGDYTALQNRLLSGNAALEPLLVLSPGAEIINRTGDLTLGSPTSTTASDWNLSTFRFGPKSAPGVLTLRAAGSLNFYNALSDGFTAFNPANNPQPADLRLWQGRLQTQNALLPVNTQTWSYRLTAGSDIEAADFRNTATEETLDSHSGFLRLGKDNGANETPISDDNALTSTAIVNRYQVIRTGSGDIEINTGRSVQLLNQFATIYTAGTRVTNPTLGGTFDTPVLNQTGGESELGAIQQTTSYPALYSMAGGDVAIRSGENIEHLTKNSAGQLIADSSLQLPNNWLYRRGYVDPATGEFGTGFFNDAESTTWWVDFSSFFQGIGALGGGNVTLTAGRDISNVDAVIPTNARMAKGAPSTAGLLELGGGDLVVDAGGNLDAGVYYVERGRGELRAGGSIITNSTRSVLTQNSLTAGQATDYTRLPTTLFAGKSSFEVSARGSVLLGPVANTFLLPGGLNNTFWYKTYFSTYGADSTVNVSALGGSLTLRTAATLPGSSAGGSTPLLQAWLTNKQLLSQFSAAANKPWLRLNESKMEPFGTLTSLMPGTLRATAFTGDLHIAGNLTLSPSSAGTLELLAGGAIAGLQPNGSVTITGTRTTTWGAAKINLSDADPAAIPGISSPFAYQTIAGLQTGEASRTGTEFRFLEFIDRLFAETGSTTGTSAVLQTKQALHAAGLLHVNDTSPVRLYAGGSDLSGLALFSPKRAHVFAARDLTDVALYLQNTGAEDTSIVSSGRDIIPSSANSTLRVAATRTGNIPNFGSGPLAGDIQISGPGTLEVLAGRTLDLGTGAGLADGTGTGITSIGNARNPYLPSSGADLIAGAGIGFASGLTGSSLNFAGFIDTYLTGTAGQPLLKELEGELHGRVFADLPAPEKNRLALRAFYLLLRNAGRDYLKDRGTEYAGGLAAIAKLFPAAASGNIFTRGRDLRTRSGGSISIFAPGGRLEMANTAIGNPLSPPGIITESGGNISVFTGRDVSIGIGRIFTLRGGSEIIWSTNGNIAAGSSSKTVQSAPPTRVLIDPQSGAVETDLAGLATGGGIGVLAAVAGVKPGDVDLIAPKGTVDAGDAGIRSEGNLNIAAAQVLNAGNISAGGLSTGTPAAPSVAIPSVSLNSAANSASSPSSSAIDKAKEATTPADVSGNLPSEFTLELVSFGGESDDEEDNDRRKER